MKNLTSPEAILMLCVAGLLDIISTITAILILLFGVGIIANYIVWVVSIIIMGTWMFIRGASSSLGTKRSGGKENEKPVAPTQSPSKKETIKPGGGGAGDTSKKLSGAADITKDIAKGNIKEIAKKGSKKLVKIGLNYLIEAVPVIGSFWPVNIIFVLMQL